MQSDLFLSFSFLFICTITNIIHNKSWLQYSEKMQLKGILCAGVFLMVVFWVLERRKEARIQYVFLL